MDYLPQNPAILVSSINMLLRDEEFDSLEANPWYYIMGVVCLYFSVRGLVQYLQLPEKK